jgi:fatty-acyl-CoA synthase
MKFAPASLAPRAQRLAIRTGDELAALRTLHQAGMIGDTDGRTSVAAIRALARWGTLGGSMAVAALKQPDYPGIVDERGSLTFGELDRRTNALADAWHVRGLRAGDGVAILARNHRGFFDATFAAAKLGARIILLNTDFAGPQIREVAEREGTKMLVHDDEYSSTLAGMEPPLGRWRSWVEPSDQKPTDGRAGPPDSLDALIAAGNPSPPPKPETQSTVVVLTSGTTGTPKGAPRQPVASLVPIAAVLSKVPYRAGEATVVCAPMFHALGLAQTLLNVGLGCTTIVRRRFDPELALADVERHRATALNAVPVMVARLLEDEDALAAHDRSSLRIIFVSGSQLGADLCQRAMATFGPIIYNLYGSTEVSYATIATPEDLSAEPASVGRPPRGSVVKILGERDTELPVGQTGRIFVGNAMTFDGYTGGGHKEVVDGLMSTGDVGHFDGAGRLFVDGRDDEMIVSGGENVFPREVEELLLAHERISDVAVIGVPDAKWGQRLRAFLVLKPGSELTEDEVKEHVRANLARFKVPREVVFVDELPRNPSGKVLKRELAATVR